MSEFRKSTTKRLRVLVLTMALVAGGIGWASAQDATPVVEPTSEPTEQSVTLVEPTATDDIGGDVADTLWPEVVDAVDHGVQDGIERQQNEIILAIILALIAALSGR